MDSNMNHDHHPKKNDKSIEDDNLSAQIAAIEAISIGRETLSSMVVQQEALENAERCADEQNRMLDRSNRMLRGMTWTGWIANMFTPEGTKSNSKTVKYSQHTSKLSSSSQMVLKNPVAGDMEGLPPDAKAAAQAIHNFHCNILLLQKCNNPNQCHIIREICENLQVSAVNQLNSLESRASHPNLMQFSKKLWNRFLQIDGFYKQLIREKTKPKTTFDNRLIGDSTSTTTKEKQHMRRINLRMDEQDDHLSKLSSNVEELKAIGFSLNESIEHQNTVIDAIHDKSESNHNQAKMLIRQADRLNRRKVFGNRKLSFESWKMIKHIPTNRYLSIDDEDKIILNPRFLGSSSTFGLWTMKGPIVGFQNKLTRKWMGQSRLMGKIVCSSLSFGRLEEWEIEDENNEKTALTCASANWGRGGWIVTEKKTHLFQINNIERNNKNESTVWSIKDIPD